MTIKFSDFCQAHNLDLLVEPFQAYLEAQQIPVEPDAEYDEAMLHAHLMTFIWNRIDEEGGSQPE